MSSRTMSCFTRRSLFTDGSLGAHGIFMMTSSDLHPEKTRSHRVSEAHHGPHSSERQPYKVSISARLLIPIARASQYKKPASLAPGVTTLMRVCSHLICRMLSLVAFSPHSVTGVSLKNRLCGDPI